MKSSGQRPQAIKARRRYYPEEEQQQARQYLFAPNLIERTREDIGRAGVIGEEKQPPAHVPDLHEQEKRKPVACN